MIQNFPADVEAAINAKVASDHYPDQETVLREALASLDEFDEIVADLCASITRRKSGDNEMPVEEAFDMIRCEITEQLGIEESRYEVIIDSDAIDDMRHAKGYYQTHDSPSPSHLDKLRLKSQLDFRNVSRESRSVRF